ncbi:MAG: ferrous iron transport protein A [Arcobacter sp.]|nr:ferrous iron transport protein A [Arcobacter sp.]
MKLSDLKTNQTAIIKNIACELDLKKRFYSFGIVRNSIITIENLSFAKNTIGINVDGTLIALRLEEASNIEVELVEEIK